METVILYLCVLYICFSCTKLFGWSEKTELELDTCHYKHADVSYILIKLLGMHIFDFI